MTRSDFWARAKPPQPGTASQWRVLIADLIDRLRNRGCTWFRAMDLSEGPTGSVYVEGWIDRPEVEPPFDIAALPLERQV